MCFVCLAPGPNHSKKKAFDVVFGFPGATHSQKKLTLGPQGKHTNKSACLYFVLNVWAQELNIKHLFLRFAPLGLNVQNMFLNSWVNTLNFKCSGH